MEELKISIESLQQEKQRIENKVDDFSRYGRAQMMMTMKT